MLGAPQGSCPAAAAVLMVTFGQARAEEFFATRDQNPLLRGFYLPLPSDARRDAEATVSATVLVSNTLNVENRSHETLFIDGESTALDLTYENSLASNWRYRLSVPVIHDSGGIFDSVIAVWHQAFGFNRGDRPYYPKRRLDYSYSGLAGVDLNHSQTSVGDLAADAGWYAVDDARRSLSVWGGLKAPTGKVADLTSDGAWDGALWVHGALRWPKWQLAGEFGVAQPFGDEIFAGAAHRDSVFGRFAATRTVGPSWSLRAQLDGQTGHVAGSDLRFLGSSLQLTLGAVRALRGRWRVNVGFAEDIAVNTAPDITFFLGIHD
ncbi:MAG: DUF3187 family protein [Gammaproteobacteria bacterium]